LGKQALLSVVGGGREAAPAQMLLSNVEMARHTIPVFQRRTISANGVRVCVDEDPNLGCAAGPNLRNPTRNSNCATTTMTVAQSTRLTQASLTQQLDSLRGPGLVDWAHPERVFVSYETGTF
jgi:hypothetical protein